MDEILNLIESVSEGFPLYFSKVFEYKHFETQVPVVNIVYTLSARDISTS